MSEITQEEAQANHDAWWSSLTDEQKQQLYDNQEKAFELTIEEINAGRINHDIDCLLPSVNYLLCFVFLFLLDLLSFLTLR